MAGPDDDAGAGPSVALVHDYLTQYGGAERVVLEIAAAFPGAPVHTSLFDPGATFPDYTRLDVRPQRLNRLGVLRRHHRLALPFLAWSFSRTVVDSKVVVCSSSGWAHGVRATGRKVVYCHTPARWLYQADRYLGGGGSRRAGARAALAALTPPLRRWDAAAAASADRYLVNSTAVRERVRSIYGRDAEVLAPPPSINADHPRTPVAGIEPGYWLCVSRLLPYKNVDAVVTAFERTPAARLVVVGSGPQESALRARAGPNVVFVGTVRDEELAWLYASSTAVVAASFEDFGLTPLEAASFGRPAAVLRWGGFLDTVVEGLSGTFFNEPTPEAIATAVRRVEDGAWPASAISAHAASFGADRFRARFRQIVDEEAQAG